MRNLIRLDGIERDKFQKNLINEEDGVRESHEALILAIQEE